MIVICDRLRNNDTTEKFSNKDAVIVKNFLLFLFQNENNNDFLFEQHNNYNNFDSNIEVERFLKFSNVVFITKRTEFTIFSFVNFLEKRQV